MLLLPFIYLKGQINNFKFADATTAKRKAFYEKVVGSIDKTIALPFDSANNEKWQAAFYNIGLVQYKPAQVNNQIIAAAKVVTNKSDDFKKAFLNLINSNYPNIFKSQAQVIFNNTTDAKIMAMAANYLLLNINKTQLQFIQQKVAAALLVNPDNAILFELNYQLKQHNKKLVVPNLQTFFTKNYLPGKVVVFSFQRKNRNYPGIAMVRDTAGIFIKNSNGKFFNVGQLARSNSNMPGYITIGNTPQGIFKITGFDTATNYFIGPTTNLQLAMPHEYNPFLVNEKLIDTTWSMQQYVDMLPPNFKNYHPIWGTFYAGKAGRTEIIAHGTTIDSSYFAKLPFYPYTPTAGCLCTKEKWNASTGVLETSDQYLLAQAVKKAGGANGYLIVIEIDDKNMPVTLLDIKKYLQ